jgi:hypothetical protein
MSNAEQWLSLRMAELENAYRLKIKGETQIWAEVDFLQPIDAFIEEKLSDINRVSEREFLKNKK